MTPGAFDHSVYASFLEGRGDTVGRDNAGVISRGLIALLFLVLSTAGLGSEVQQVHARGTELYKQHKYTETIGVLEQSVALEKPGSDAFNESAMMIAQSYFMTSQSSRAIPWLEKVPATNESSYMLGYAYQQAGDMAHSVAAFARLFGVNPTSAAAHLVTGQMLIKKQLEEPGAAEVGVALSMDPNIPEAHYLLAEVKMFKGDVEGSIRDLTAELALHPTFSMAWYRLGDAYTRQDKWDAAIPSLQRAVWLNQSFSGSYILLGKSYFKKGDYTNAEKFLRQALELDPKNYSATFQLGKTLVAEGKNDEGRAALEQSQKLPH